MKKNKLTLEFFSNSKLNMSRLIRQSWATTIARHRLSTAEHRIMTRILERLQPEMSIKLNIDEIKSEENRVLKFLAKSLMPEGSTHHAELRRALQGLTKKDISFKKKLIKGSVYIYTHLIQEVRYETYSEFVEIEISKSIMPCFLALAHGYTKYNSEISFNASSSNIMKIYQYISHFREKKQIQINIDKFKDMLGLGGKYPEPRHFKQWVLTPAIKELKKVADVWFSIADVVKEGRKVVGWKLNIHKKRVAKKLPIAIPTEKDTQLKLKLIDDFHLGVNQAQKVVDWSKESDNLKLLQRELYDLHILKINGKIGRLGSLGAYVVKTLNEKFGLKL